MMEKCMKDESALLAEIPSEIVIDTRLTLEMMRVLITLYSFRNKTTGIASPTREELSGQCGMHPSNISSATKKLSDLGWLKKNGKGGNSEPTRYTFAIPKAVLELAEFHKERSRAWVEKSARPPISSRVKQLVFERDAYRCVKCSGYKSLCVDHKFPYSLGGGSDPENLQTLCWDCNSKKSNKVEVVE